MKTASLKWIPLPVNPPISPPRGLKDFQVGWFWNIFWASLQAEPLGYLSMSEDFWMLSGALTRERWNANCSAVLAAFEIVDISGHGRLLYFPPLKAIIEEQLARMRSKKGVPLPFEDFNNLNSNSQNVAPLSLSFLDVDVGSKKTKEEVRPEIPESLEIRNELERADGIARAKAAGFTVREDGTCYRRKLAG